jgi:pSer/pThr/pTyr-binding forkhead associated (FHA) protein
MSTSTLEVRLRQARDAHTVVALRGLIDDLDTEISLPAHTTHVTLGRHPNCDVVIDDPSVSRVHASLRREAGRWVLHDLASRNGTFLNGRRAAQVEVLPGDELRLGSAVRRLA